MKVDELLGLIEDKDDSEEQRKDELLSKMCMIRGKYSKRCA